MPLLFPDGPDEEFVEGTLYADLAELRAAGADLLGTLREEVEDLATRALDRLSRIFYRD